MGTVFYGVTGEGRGHATRVRAVVEGLRKRHRVRIYAPAMAYDFLAPVYRGTDVAVHRIPGLCFHYSRSGKLHYARTGWYAAGYLRGLPALVGRLQKDMERERPDLVITDFEPSLPRAARRVGIPYISLNHQHFLATYDLSCLPGYLRRHAAFMAGIVGLYYRRQVETIVSSFYFPPLKQHCADVHQIGVLLRPEILHAKAHHSSYLVAYLRRFMTPAIHHSLSRCGREVRVYGLGARPAEGNLKYYDIDPFRFVEDLAGCAALVSNAGNQLLGEALYLEKPALVMPERGNFEQFINAHFLVASGAGQSVDMEAVTDRHLAVFLEQLDTYRSAIDPTRLCGNFRALEILSGHLPGPSVVEKPAFSRLKLAKAAS